MSFFACTSHKALKPGDTWPYNPLSVEFFAGQLEKQGWFVVFECPSYQPGLQGIQIDRGSLTKPQIGPHVTAMITLRASIVVLGKGTWSDAELFGNKRDRFRRYGLEVRWHKAQIA